MAPSRRPLPEEELGGQREICQSSRHFGRISSDDPARSAHSPEACRVSHLSLTVVSSWPPEKQQGGEQWPGPRG